MTDLEEDIESGKQSASQIGRPFKTDIVGERIRKLVEDRIVEVIGSLYPEWDKRSVFKPGLSSGEWKLATKNMEPLFYTDADERGYKNPGRPLTEAEVYCHRAERGGGILMAFQIAKLLRSKCSCAEEFCECGMYRLAREVAHERLK